MMMGGSGMGSVGKEMVDTRLLRIEPAHGRPVALGLREKRPSGGLDRPPVLLVHGATLGAALFDLPRAGYSLMAALARDGRAVYAVDVRGYGTSLGDFLDRPLEDRPIARAEEVAPDIAASVAFVRERCGASVVDLVGFSWGSVTASRYASAHPAHVRRLALYAPLFAESNGLWLDRIADPQDRRRLVPGFGAWRLVTAANLIERWNGDLPHPDPSRFREEGVGEMVFETIAALDPTAATRRPPAFRCPNGALADMVRIFNGEALYEPAALTMPVLVVRGEHDTTSTDTDARGLLARLASPEKQYRVVAGGSHFLCIERSRQALYDVLGQFLDQ